MKTLKLLFFIFVLAGCSHNPLLLKNNRLPQSDQKDPFTALVEWETEANAVSKRSTDVFKVEHYEFPARYIAQDIAERMDESVKTALLFEKDGETYVRWFINPEDTVWHLKIKEHLEANNIPFEKKQYFDGYQSASRSYLLVDPETGANFSLKGSTNVTGGNWKDKKQTWEDAQEVRRVMDMIDEVHTKTPISRSYGVMDEAMALGIPELDQALIVRSLDQIKEEKAYLLPGFSALYETVGKEIAELNGFDDPVEFWRINYSDPLAKALAELAAIGGLSYDSPHSQNFMIELDKNLKPTGKIILKDLGDVEVITSFFDNSFRGENFRNWSGGKNASNHAKVGLLWGNSPPSWLSSQDFHEWMKSFFTVYFDRYRAVTGISETELPTPNIPASGFGYYGQMITPQSLSEQWKSYLEAVDCYGGSYKTKSGKLCSELLQNIPEVKFNRQNCGQLIRSVAN
ncbi:MAG: hypothetical protein NXH75_15340 [Halobacteriovoraceae bacterium]|nr:hypothetical protein [Halobacteriovoraceae bacterium]